MGWLDSLPRGIRRPLRKWGRALYEPVSPQRWRRRWRALSRLPRVLARAWRHLLRAIATPFTKPYRILIWRTLAITPVLVVAFSLIFFLVLSRTASRRANNWYAQQAQAALEKKEYAKARLGYQGLLLYEPQRPEYRLGLATALAGLGDNSAAGAMMRRLAPEDAEGYGKAHVLIAEQLLRNPESSPNYLDEAEKHLLKALNADAKDPQAHALLAVLYSRRDRWDLVEKHLPLAGLAADEMALAAARMFAAHGRAAEADSWAARAAAYYAPLTKSDASNDEVWLNYAQATLYLRDFGRALDILAAAWKQTNHPRFRAVYAHVAFLWLHEVEGMPSARRLALLENALTWNPQDPDLLKLVLDAKMREAARQVAPTTAPMSGAGMQALIEAIALCRQGKASEVPGHLETAMALGGPQMTAIAANVASAWGASKAIDSGGALVLIDALAALGPSEPIVQRARGLVVSGQGRWSEALPDLEQVVAKFPQDSQLHAALTLAYEHTGQPDLAAQHRRLAQPATAPATGPTSRAADAK